MVRCSNTWGLKQGALRNEQLLRRMSGYPVAQAARPRQQQLGSTLVAVAEVVYSRFAAAAARPLQGLQ
jgi:hypothetical protein